MQPDPRLKTWIALVDGFPQKHGRPRETRIQWVSVRTLGKPNG
ncbi:hypothetical protein RISK_005053 [Rhodopirellula islandica]|uniref:Uncharacterized protein n=1 Tax=Rhodopirellula islandica TaxID=595434 RepID=A0A0J1B7Q1_RHOIS|nr:hypothetical protein RISK_005053 [Rhodopirellula islandica]